MEKSIERPQVLHKGYNHAHYEFRRSILRFLMRTIGFELLAKVDHVEGLENIPASGPALLMINHIAFIDPIVVLHVVPRNIVPLAKVEVYNYPFVGIIPKLWGVVPVRREEFDRRAIQQVLDVLRAGELVLVAPEGTRNAFLQRAKEGIAYLASRANAPIIPVAIEGTPGFPALRFTQAWQGPGATVRFGRPFHYRAEYRRAGHADLHKMTDEAMYILAAMLPKERRGAYADLSEASQDTIEWS